MRNLNQYMKRLRQALLSKQFQIKININEFYSKEQNRMIAMYTLSTPILMPIKGVWKTRDYEIIHTASQYDVVMTLKEIWEALEDW